MSNKITINKIDSICKKKDPVVFTYATEDDEIKIEFNTSLSLVEEQIFIDRIVDSVVSANDYYPGMYDAVFFATFLQMCSNISVPTKKTDAASSDTDNKIFDMEKINRWMYDTTVFYDLLNNEITGSYIKGLLNKVNRKVEFRLKQLSNKTPLSDFIENLNHLLESGELMNALSGSITDNQEPQVVEQDLDNE